MRGLPAFLVFCIGISMSAAAFWAGVHGRSDLGRDDVVVGGVSGGIIFIIVVLFGVTLFGERD